MRGTICLVVLGFALAATAVIAEDAPGGKQQIVDQRVAAMKQMGGKVKEAFELSDADAAGARAKLAEAIAIAQTIPSRFPAGTADGDPGVVTRALPKIWSDRPGFEKLAAALVTALQTADEKLAASEDAKAAFDSLRKACGSCHDEYRGPKK